MGFYLPVWIPPVLSVAFIGAKVVLLGPLGIHRKMPCLSMDAGGEDEFHAVVLDHVAVAAHGEGLQAVDLRIVAQPFGQQNVLSPGKLNFSWVASGVSGRTAKLGHSAGGSGEVSRLRQQRQIEARNAGAAYLVEVLPLLEQDPLAFKRGHAPFPRTAIFGGSEHLVCGGERGRGFFLQLVGKKELGNAQRVAEDTLVDRHGSPGTIHGRVVVNHRIGRLAERGLAPVAQNIRHALVRIPEQPGVEVDRKAILDVVYIHVRTAFGRKRDLGDHGDMAQLLASLDGVVDHAQERREASVLREYVILVRVVADRQTCRFPFQKGSRYVVVQLAVRMPERVDIAAHVGRVLDELAVSYPAFGHRAIALIGNGGEPQRRELLPQGVGQAVVEPKPSSGNTRLRALVTAAIGLIVAWENAQDVQLRAFADVLGHALGHDSEHSRIAEANVLLIARALHFGEVLWMPVEDGLVFHAGVVGRPHGIEPHPLLLGTGGVTVDVDEVAGHPFAENLMVSPVAA